MKDATTLFVSASTRKYGSCQPATLTWSKLTVTAKDLRGESKNILDDVCGYVAPRDMLAIMGPSGCGKSTLLDALAGRLHRSVKQTGEVLLNGYRSCLTYGLSAYVTQDEVLVGTLSVRETLLYAALLRLPAAMAYSEKLARVNDAIEELGLEGAQHTKIGTPFIKGISGGQKRRVAIGCELITYPSLLFLDEPTSGLDAAAAFHVMTKIRHLCTKNRTVITVIHQPSSEVFELFDKLCLLSKGKLVYFGQAEDALGMFEEAGLPCPPLRNPTDHFLHVINADFRAEESNGHDADENVATLLQVFNAKRGPALEAAVKERSMQGEEYSLAREQPNWFYQVWVLTKRMLVNNWRNIAVFWLRLGMFLMLCICMGTIYFDLGYDWVGTYSRSALLFFVVAFLTFMSIAGFPAFQEDMSVFIRERLNGYYSVATFALANTLASAPFIFGIAVSSSAVVYWLVGLNDQGDRFPYFFLNLFAALMCVESLMMAIAAVVPHYLMGIAGAAARTHSSRLDQLSDTVRQLQQQLESFAAATVAVLEVETGGGAAARLVQGPSAPPSIHSSAAAAAGRPASPPGVPTDADCPCAAADPAAGAATRPHQLHPPACAHPLPLPSAVAANKLLFRGVSSEQAAEMARGDFTALGLGEGGAGILGMYMLVCGYFQPVGELPAPVWRYPMHYIAYHSYTFAGFMHNEFDGTTGWRCPCYDQPQGCGPAFDPPSAPCTMTGQQVLDYWTLSNTNKWVDIGIQCGMIAIYRLLFWGMLRLKEALRVM
ncbi:hypothetical protein HXX76_006299 [Chlamydomonas incerta]|uniref:ABC transporter domain-containing protein n=1 Tax=Chlamydomonas incerta TaxID=51695 RepID=A0A835TFB9_CHLIN|nr:hypothetical protein HXX76_006299 [Chlamydomonas incerta]|eukprot:KAG2436775.1 hypothetical protein HXX76_006299 [Chlamydomonas incerta]